jgi:1-aminocyclopropane-1-carboxylate deaminase/D-cysteine desulfhydrase-like pyridoxal-dependent ACC family enzyme
MPVPRGGSTPVGAAGFADAAAEVVGQWPEPGPPATVVIPVGSGGSVAGLLAGLAAAGAEWPVVGASVSRPPEEITATVLVLAEETARFAGTPPPRADLLTVVDARGPGFGVTSPADRAAADLVARTEGVLLDGTYGAKAAAVLVDRLAAGTLPAGPVLLWLTGGIASALAHAGPHVSGIPGYSREFRSRRTEEDRERTP